MKKILLLYSCLSLFACKQENLAGQEDLFKESFELKIEHFTYNPEYRVEYLLTADSIIVNRHWPDADTLVFGSELQVTDSLIEISKIDLRNVETRFANYKSPFMKNHYSNPCILEGLQLRMVLSMDSTEQKIGISNFYLLEFGLPIRLINGIVPVELRIPYDKRKLTEDLIDCEASKYGKN